MKPPRDARLDSMRTEPGSLFVPLICCGVCAIAGAFAGYTVGMLTFSQRDFNAGHVYGWNAREAWAKEQAKQEKRP